MRFISKLFRYLAAWCNAISLAWRFRKYTTRYHRNGDISNWTETRKGFWGYLRLYARAVKWPTHYGM